MVSFCPEGRGISWGDLFGGDRLSLSGWDRSAGSMSLLEIANPGKL